MERLAEGLSRSRGSGLDETGEFEVEQRQEPVTSIKVSEHAPTSWISELIRLIWADLARERIAGNNNRHVVFAAVT
jgi:hypothetical protein